MTGSTTKARGLEWHGSAHCLQSGCDWSFDARGVMAAIDEDAEARRHERQTKEAGQQHPVTNSLHRMDYCSQLGCTE